MVELTKINWKQNGDKWTAFDENDNQIIGWLHDKLRDTWFYCYSDDICTSWFKDTDGRWYYFFPDQCVDYNRTMYKGEMKTGWLKDGDKWYYLIPKTMQSEAIYKGQMLQSTTEEISGIDYKFDDNGAMVEDCKGVSSQGIDFIKSFEGYFSKPYFDCVGVKTVGYGMTGSEIEGLTYVTEEQATNMLKNLVNNKYYPPIKKALDLKGISLNQPQIDALVSMAYNVGYIGVLSSTLFKNICNGITDPDIITSNFTAWSKAGGQVITGLLRRRQAEANIYLNGIYKNN